MRKLSILFIGPLFALVLIAPVSANSPAVHFTEDVTGDVILCETTTYTITSGELAFVIHEGQAAQGNQNVTGTLTPRKVIAVDEAGNEYSVRGAFWFGETFNANTGGFQGTFTGKLQIVGAGQGTVDSVNLTFHITAQPNNFVLKEFDFGTCEEPA